MTTIQTVSLDNLDNLGVDDFNRLYWKGEQIAMTSMLTFPTWVNYAVGAAAIVTAVHVTLLIVERVAAWLN